MPTEDPAPDAPRIGSELELFKPADAGRSFRKPPPLVVPAPRRRFSLHRRPPSGWSVDDDADLRRARLTVVVVSLVALVTLVTFIAVAHRRGDGGGPAPTAAEELTFTVPPFPDLPVPASVEPASSRPRPTFSTVAPRPPASPSRRSPAPSRTPSRTPSPAVPPAPAPVNLTVGARVSLELSGRPGVLVRHENALARVDEFPPGRDRQDAVFKVGKAVARGCVSLESANYPGYFLRHRNFVLHLDPADESPLFRQDSAFCQVDVGSGAFVLRSVNYPDHYLAVQDAILILSEVDPSAALRFVARPA